MNTIRSCHRPTYTTISLVLLGCLIVSPVLAETRYIKPSLDVGIRQSQSNTAKTVANVPMGTSVELVQGDKEWSLIRLQNNSEGWVRNRFLSNTPLLPPTNLKGAAGNETAPIDVPARFKELADDNGRLRKELATCTADRNTIADKYQTLAGDPNSMLHAKTSLGEAQRQIEELQAKLAATQIENTVLEKNESIKWFLAGSIVLLFGWLVGRLTANGRKKKPSLL